MALVSTAVVEISAPALIPAWLHVMETNLVRYARSLAPSNVTIRRVASSVMSHALHVRSRVRPGAIIKDTVKCRVLFLVTWSPALVGATRNSHVGIYARPYAVKIARAQHTARSAPPQMSEAPWSITL